LTLHSALRGLARLAPLLVGAALFAIGASAAEPLSARRQAEDFDALWRAIDTGYVRFGAGRGPWQHLRSLARHKAELATSREAFVEVLESALATLHDDSVVLAERSRSSRRRIPYESDTWAAWKGDAAIIEGVRTFSDADVAGLRPGDTVTRIDGIPVERAVSDFLGASPRTPAAMDWALRHVLAGPRTGVQHVEIRDRAPLNALSIERNATASRDAPAIVARRMGDARDIGYIRLRIGADDARLAQHFDQAARYLVDARALIVDLRENIGPGSPAATRAILQRFVSSPTPWQVREARGKPPVTDTIEPRGPVAIDRPLVVLVDRWTAAEGEALADGLRTLAGAQVVGTRTAGLRAQLREVKLPNSGIVVRYPAERIYRLNGERGDEVPPTLEVDLAAPQGGPGDPILYQALKLLEPCPGPACRSARGSPPPARAFPRR
jgi:Peptidase family S41